MSGCYGNDPEDRARERELNRYLDSQEKTLREEERYKSELESRALEALKDSGYLYDVFDCDPDRVFELMAQMFIAADKRERGIEHSQQVMSAFVDFRDALAEMAKGLGQIQTQAEEAADAEDWYKEMTA